MAIHILAADVKPPIGQMVAVNCGLRLPFPGGINVSWDDGRVCDPCLRAHRSGRRQTAKTLAFSDEAAERFGAALARAR